MPEWIPPIALLSVLSVPALASPQATPAGPSNPDTVVRTDSVREGVRRAELAGKPLEQYPWFEYVDAFNEGEPVWLALDSAIHGKVPDGVVDVYVVEHRENWRMDITLTDVAGAARPVDFDPENGLADNTTKVDLGFLPGTEGDRPALGYDLVVDVNRNGFLDAGDLLDGGVDGAGFYVVSRTDLLGPYGVEILNYAGPGAFMGQRAFYPTEIASLGKRTLVVISHGNGHQYTWYNHLGNFLASWGYIVMSHENNTGPGINAASTTTVTNTDYFLGALDEIGGGVLDGYVDVDTIVWIGHSRGGEGIVRAHTRLRDGDISADNFGPENIKLLSSIAPTVFLPNSFPDTVPYHLWTGGADNDVNGCANCSICKTFRLHDRALDNRYSISLHGVGHAAFHAGPGGLVAQGPCLNNRGRTHRIMKVYLLALLKHELEDEGWATEFLWRQHENLQAIGLPNQNPCVVIDLMYRPGASQNPFVIDDYQLNVGTGGSSSLTNVTFDVLNVVEDSFGDGNSFFTFNVNDPMNGQTSQAGVDQARGVVFDYVGGDKFYAVDVRSDARDFRQFRYLSFRAGQATRHPFTIAELGDLTFSVRLTDSRGGSSTINVGAYGGGLEEPYQRTGCGVGVGWANELETIRIRLTDFLHDGAGFSLRDVVEVRFLFGPSHGDAVGRIAMDDIQLERR